jgi:hypothetical protein
MFVSIHIFFATIFVFDVRNNDETKGEIGKTKKTSPTKLLSPEGCPYELETNKQEAVVCTCCFLLGVIFNML